MVYYFIEGYLSRNFPPCWEREEVEGEASWKEPCDGTPFITPWNKMAQRSRERRVTTTCV